MLPYQVMFSTLMLPTVMMQTALLQPYCSRLDSATLDDTIRRLETLLHRLEAQKFNSERDRSRYELVSSVLSRLRGVRADLTKFRNNEFNDVNATEDIARSVWNAPPSSRPGTLSVLSDDSFISACDEFVSACASVRDRTRMIRSAECRNTTRRSRLASTSKTWTSIGRASLWPRKAR